MLPEFFTLLELLDFLVLQVGYIVFCLEDKTKKWKNRALFKTKVSKIRDLSKRYLVSNFFLFIDSFAYNIVFHRMTKETDNLQQEILTKIKTP